MQRRNRNPIETAKSQPLQKRGSDENLKEHFNLTVNSSDKKTFAGFTQKYPKPQTSKVIHALIRKHMKGETPENA